MTSTKGFGKPSSKPSSKPKKKATESAKQRQQAKKQYETLKGKGLPEFNIFVRLPEKPNNWMPVGAIAVQRSSAINAAIFQNEEALLKGALRLFPKLTKRVEDLEYGYRLKDFNDEPIQPAQRPTPSPLARLLSPLKTWISTLLQKLRPQS